MGLKRTILSSGGGTSTAPTKRVTMPLASDQQGNNSSFADVNMRYPIALPVTTTRWRLRVKAAPSGTATVNLTATYLGTPSTASGIWAGVLTGLTQALPSATLSGATEFTSAWVTDPALQIQSDTPRALSVGFTTAGGVTVYKGDNLGFCYYGTGAAAAAGTGTGTGSTSPSATFLDIRFEYETTTTLPVVLVVSDSTGVGYVDGPAGSLPGPTETWPHVAALRERFLVVNASAGGKSYADFTSSSPLYARLDLSTTPPEVAILNCGINEAANGVAIATYQTNMQAAIAQVRALGAARVVAATVMPQPRWKVGYLTAGGASGVTSVSTSVAYANADVVDIDFGRGTAETRTVSGASTGTGPYTTTFTAATGQAHAAGATISLQPESRRRECNAYIRSKPAGVDHVIDFDDALADNPTVGSTFYEWFGPGQIHPGSAAYARLGATVRLESPTAAVAAGAGATPTKATLGLGNVDNTSDATAALIASYIGV